MRKIFTKIIKIPIITFLAGIMVVLLLFVVLKPQKTIKAYNPSSLLGECFADMESYSTTLRTDAPWSIFDLPIRSTMTVYYPNASAYDALIPIRRYIDLNGDGLVDYLYDNSYNFNNGQDNVHKCVMLNNGAGWDIVYRCKVQMHGSALRYYGDCGNF